MKKILILICAIFIAGIARADTIDINWLNEDGTTYDTSTCTVGGDVILPTTPTKYGYTFQGWARYIPIEYIESTGTQYIETGYIQNQTTKSRTKVNLKNACPIVIGNWRDRLFNVSQIIYCDIPDGQTGRVSGGEFKNNVTYDFLSGYHYVKNYQTDALLIGSVAQNPRQWVASDTMKIFLRDSTVSSSQCVGKIYLIQIWDNDILVRDFIPVLDSNGVACLFDKVEGKFYYNAGTGNFIAGPEITE